MPKECLWLDPAPQISHGAIKTDIQTSTDICIPVFIELSLFIELLLFRV